MKPADISQEVWSKYCDDAAKALDKMPEEGPQLRSHRVGDIARAIQRAVEREREACARTCSDYRYEHKIVGERYAAAIRARGK